MLLLAGMTCVALWVWPGYLLPKPWIRPGPAPEAMAIFFSSDAAGYIEPCGCTLQRWGGVARLGGALRKLQKPATRLRVDVGDMTGGTLRWQRVGLQHYLAALGQMDYSAANLGDMEIAMPASDLRAIAKSSPVPLVSANVLDAATGQPLVASHRQILINNLRVTILGVVSPSANRTPGQGLKIADIDQSLGAILPTLRPHTDVIVLLAAADEPTMRHIAQAHPELDVIVGGRVNQASQRIEQVGTCRLAWQAKKGQMLGRMDIQIRPDGQPGPATGVMMMLDNDIPEDPALLDVVAQYNAELSRLNRQGGLAELGVPITDPPAGKNTYVGSENCRVCHPAEYKTWRQSDHSRAYESLLARQRDNNPDCVSCHVVDLGAGDGFAGLSQTPERANVQCESCHGRGADHASARTKHADVSVGKMSRVLSTSCEVCHDYQHSPEFSYTTYWTRIEHARQ